MPPGPHPSKPRSSAPNVIVLIADDHRADAIGALGNPAVSTPELDALIRRGTTFTHARIAGGLMPAVCSPSRACLLTGCAPFRAEAAPALIPNPPFEVQLPTSALTLPELFQNAGYDTFLTGKWHNDEAALLRSFAAGRNIFQGGMWDHTNIPVRDLDEIRRGGPPRIGTGFSTEIFCDSAEEFVRNRNGERPFFAWVALTSPHDPRTPPASFRDKYDAPKIPLPVNFQPAHSFDNGELEVRDEQLLPHPLNPDQVREALADYYGMISHHDACIGRIISALAETGQMENTIVIYLSDHGLALGSHGLLGKQNLYEPSIRVPLILAGPGIPTGFRRDGLAYAFDLYATLCELTGLAAPVGIDSRSLQPMIVSERATVRDVICAAYMDCQRMVTDGAWKLIVYRVAGNQRIQLFNLADDPDELRDRSQEPAQVGRLVALQARLSAWQIETGDRWMPLASVTTSQPSAT